MMVAYRVILARRRRLVAIVAACVAVGALVAGLLLPQYFSNATDTSTSTVYKTATNATTASKAASPDAPGGAVRGTAKPGDTLKWVVSYKNNTKVDAGVDLKDVITNAGTYVSGSLQTPPNTNAVGSITPQYSTNGGGSWADGTPPAGANGLGFKGTLVADGTAAKSLSFPNPPVTAVAATGGDSYNIVVRGNLLYGVYHHNAGAVVYCAQVNGQTCPGWPTNSPYQTWSSTPGTAIGTGTSFPGTTAWQGGTWISGNKLFWFTGLNDKASVGTACLDLSTSTPASCGYIPLANGLRVIKGGTGAPIGSTGLSVNGKIYAIAETTSGSYILCVTPATGAGCGTLKLTSEVTTTDAAQSSAQFGSYVFAPVKSSAAGTPWQVYCYAAGGGLCAGSWPVASTSTSNAFGAPVFAPILSTTGAVTGVCTIFNNGESGSACWSSAGARLANNPYTGVGAQYIGAGAAAGDAYVSGTKVYVSKGDTVTCVDFAAYSGSGTVPTCAGFTDVSNGVNYTVRPASDIAPNCLVATGDRGIITLFNAVSGGGCTSSSGAQTVTATPVTSYCGSGAAGFQKWDTLTIPGLTATQYTSATVTLTDQTGAVISGFSNRSVAAGVPLSLSTIPVSVTKITASVTLIGVNDPTKLSLGQVQISWVGSPPEMCFQTVAPAVSCEVSNATLSNTASAVTTPVAGAGDGPSGNTSGAAVFDLKAAASQCTYSVKKTASVQAANPGDRVTYSIVVTNTGSQSIAPSFTDDLADVLKEATYNADATADRGAVSYAGSVLSWSIPSNPGLTVGQSATIRYSVTVKNPPVSGDHSMGNTVVAPRTGGNCAEGSADAGCSAVVIVTVKSVVWKKIDATAAKNTLPGSEWTFTPVDGSGKPTGSALKVTDCVAGSAVQCTGADRDPLTGMFRLDDLGPGTYQLVETKAPVGFTLNSTPITVTVLAAQTTVTLADVVNKQMPVPVIPLTGGLGTDLLTFIGGGLLALVVALAGWTLVRRRRRTV